LNGIKSILKFATYCYNDQIKEDKMGKTHSVLEGEEAHTKFLLESLKGRGLLKDLGIDRRIILKWIFDK
jgi:hypothetical protein